MSNIPNDDLFEGTKMTFGEHLEELRVALYRSMVGLVLGFLIALWFADEVVKTIQGPLKDALDTYYLEQAAADLAAEYETRGEAIPPELRALIRAGLIQDSIRVDAEGFYAAMRTAAPDDFQGIDYIPYRFVAGDVVNSYGSEQFAELCRQLVSDSESDNETPGNLMWSLLTKQQQERVEEIADADSISDADRQAVVDVLNSLVQKPDLVKSKHFKGVDGTGQPIEQTSSFFRGLVQRIQKALFSLQEDKLETAYKDTVTNYKSQLKDGEDAMPLATNEMRRLNKLLIASAYSDHLRRPRRLIVEVPIWKPTDIRVQTLNAHEAFMIWLKAGFISGLVITSPWIFWQIWNFVAAGLYPHEKRYVFVYLPFSLILFLAGVCVAFFFVFEPVLNFLFSFNKMMEIDPDPRISEWLSFVLFLPLGFGIAFQLPLVMLFLNRIGIFPVEVFLEKWRIAILVIFVISMLLTPADPISMLLMAVPLTVLYFLGIVLCKWMPRGRNPFDEAYEP